jgi:precorrin-6Y C5,15-methyltransferase (decarboxylating)
VALELGSGAADRIVPLGPGLPDSWFEHDGQLTKQDIRAVTLAALAPRRGEMLWDIGAGSGSVGIEWMLTNAANRAVAIERDPVRAGRIARNAAALGVPDLSIVAGSAPEALHDLPRPDAVFVGGGANACIDAAWGALPSFGRMVANGITIETQAELIRRFKAIGGSLKTIQIAHANQIGGFNAMRPAMTVTQWAATKP